MVGGRVATELCCVALTSDGGGWNLWKAATSYNADLCFSFSPIDVQGVTRNLKRASNSSRNLDVTATWLWGRGKALFTANAHATLPPHLLAALADAVSEQTDRAKNSPENGGFAATA